MIRLHRDEIRPRTTDTVVSFFVAGGFKHVACSTIPAGCVDIEGHKGLIKVGLEEDGRSVHETLPHN